METCGKYNLNENLVVDLFQAVFTDDYFDQYCCLAHSDPEELKRTLRRELISSALQMAATTLSACLQFLSLLIQSAAPADRGVPPPPPVPSPADARARSRK